MKSKIYKFMTALIITLTNLLISLSVFAQAPQKMSYQAVIRDAGNALVTSHAVGMRISILQGSPTGTAVYVETQTPATNANGLISIEIGGGTGFDAINWANGPYFLKTETDPTGGTSYTISGTSQLLSMPYALYAKAVASYPETDPVFGIHPAYGITGANITNWNTAYGWGNHAGLYRPIGYVPAWSEITSKPTTVAGYGITDAVNTTGTQTIGGNKTFTGITTVPTPVNSTDAATKAYVDVLLQRINELESQPGIVKDYDGNFYTTVKIGNQVWMAENLKTIKYNDGTAIPLVTVNTAWSSLTGPGYCWYNNDETANKATYGGLYNWYTVNTGNLCPTGWHVPTDAEWTTLTTFLGGITVAGGKLKETGTAHWQSPNTGATNETGFTALPGGNRSNSGSFGSIFLAGYLWSSTVYSTADAWSRFMNYLDGSLTRNSVNKSFGFSVRCLRD